MKKLAPALNAKLLGQTVAVFLPIFLLFQVPSFLEYDKCLREQVGSCEISLGTDNLLIQFLLPLVAFAIVVYARKIHLRNVGLWIPKLSIWKKYIIHGVLLIALINILLALASNIFPILGKDQFNFGSEVTAVGLVPFIVAAVVLAPLLEEILFRGFEFSILKKHVSTVLAAVISSATFGLVHGQLNVAIVTFIFGLYLCYMATKTKSLVPGLILHFINNSVAMIFLVVSL